MAIRRTRDWRNRRRTVWKHSHAFILVCFAFPATLLSQEDDGQLPASPWSRQSRTPRVDMSEDSTLDSGMGRRVRNGLEGEPSSESRPATLIWGQIQPATIHGKNGGGRISQPAAKPTKWSEVVPPKSQSLELVSPEGHAIEQVPDISKLDRASLVPQTQQLTTRSVSSPSSRGKAVTLPSSTSQVTIHPIQETAAQPVEFDVRRTRSESYEIARSPRQSSLDSLQRPLSDANSTAKVSLLSPVPDSNIEKRRLAHRVSQDILASETASSFRPPVALERPAGWQSVESELRSHLEQCDRLLRRGAVHSARAEVVSGLRRLFRTMDAYRGELFSEPSFDLFLTAFREEADFHAHQGIRSIDTLVDTHSTPALKRRPLENVSPEIASQHYRGFARDQLLIAADGHPWVADLLYAYGKTLEKEAESDLDSSLRLRAQAVICYQAAVKIKPNQSDASNQLGYALIHLDRLEEAYEALQISIQSNPSSKAWSNLAEVFRRYGESDKAEYAVREARMLQPTTSQSFSEENPEVTPLDPSTFAKYSPIQNLGAPVATASAAPSGPKPAVSQTPSGSFFSKVFSSSKIR
ncbi:MAG: hypothetical protein KGQ60_05625 [Planctomycetes bacterium]|nr:hypothetical protein [Planctomycetota bacterium]